MWRVPRWPMDIRLVPPVPFSPPDSSIRCGSMGSRAENGSAWTPSNRCVSLKKHATLATLWRNYYEKALALRDGNNLFCCPSAYRKGAIGLRWYLGPRLPDATRRMRSHLQLHRQYI